MVAAVRRAHKEGMTQLEIARRVGRSQPEVSRLLKFHGSTGLARTVRRHAPEVRAVITEAGGRNVRVFGSVATGEDGPESDVDLLFSAGEPISLMEMSALELRLEELLGVPVDLVSEESLRPGVRRRILAHAVML